MFPSSKRSKQKIEQSSLSELTPIYGPVIQSAPSWAGPFTMPAVPPTRLVPTENQKTQQYYDQLLQNLQNNVMIGAAMMVL
jgi:hypothetical protein